MINIDGDTVIDKYGRQLARLSDYGRYVKVKRLQACTIGDYFAILNWLMDWGYNAI